MKQEEIEMQLWEFIDGTCNEADKDRISLLVSTDEVWKTKYAELTAFHRSIAIDLATEQPSMRFSQNVMDVIAKEHIAPATKKYINKGIIRGIAAFFIISISLVLVYSLMTINLHEPVAQTNFHFDLSKFFNGTVFNIFIMVNIVLGLVLIDSALRKTRMLH
jgi:hypothetical protein